VSALTNTITRRVMEDQNNAAQREVNRLTDNTIEALEKQFEQDNGDESDNA
jgi:ribosome recycling factor